MEIIIIGGGASGLTSAIKALKLGAKVTILERNNKCGKKLLLTGNSRCNYWNSNIDVDFYHASNIEILKKILDRTKDKVLDFFDSLGIEKKIINGYYYPYSRESITVLNNLLLTAINLGVTIKYQEEVIKIEKNKKFLVFTKNNCYKADKVIIATGGMSYPKTGSDGLGYEVVKKLGHSVNTPLPALVKLNSRDNYYKDLKGVRCEVILSVFENNKKVKEERGEILFTDKGISGICTFNISGIISRGLFKKQKEEIFINFVPWFESNKNDFKKFIDKKDKKLCNYNISQILEGFLDYKIVNLILKLANVNKEEKWNVINKDKIVDLLFEFPFRVLNTNEINEAEVTTGGVPLEEIDFETMESKIVKNLYLVGEILDVDGICGGYNLGFAWISGLNVLGDEIKND